MKNSKNIALVSAVLTAIVSQGALAVPDQPAEWEKCAGIAKAGKNDCGALDGKHECANLSTVDNAKTEWVYVAKGTCEKISGGTVAAIKPAKVS